MTFYTLLIPVFNLHAERKCHAPAVTCVGHVQFSQEVNDGEGCAAAGDVVDLLFLLNLGILRMNTWTVFVF